MYISTFRSVYLFTCYVELDRLYYCQVYENNENTWSTLKRNSIAPCIFLSVFSDYLSGHVESSVHVDISQEETSKLQFHFCFYIVNFICIYLAHILH